MSDISALVAGNLDIWTSATQRKSGAGRGGGKRISLYGIERLRALILDLAVRGKLVAQDAGDEPASELIKRFVKQRSDLVAKKFMRMGKPLPKLATNELRFEKPPGWGWIRLGDLGDWGAGATPNRKKSVYYGGEIPWFKSGELSADFIYISEEAVTELALRECSLRFNSPGDVLIAMYGATIGKASILKVKATTNQAVCACTPFDGVNNRFLLLTLKAMKPIFVGQGAGGAQPNISREKIIATPMCLPPLAEQRRIVAKVDELMALCDALERESADAMAAHQALVEALLATLVNSADAIDLATNWARLESHFDTLFTTDASIEALKQTILDLAVRGKLVEQDARDGAASDLFKRIVASNSKRVAAGDAKKMRSNSDIPSGPNPFDLPPNWVWTSLDRIAYKLTDGAHHTPTYTDEGVPFLSVKDMSSGRLDFSDTRFISAEEHADLYRRCDPEKGDLLITKVGTTGVPVIVDTDQQFSLFVSVALVKAPWEFVSVEFLRLLVDSPFVRKQSAEGTQGIGNKNLVLRTIGAFRISLPPLAEQHRIVAKVDALMGLCDQLKTRLADAAQTQRQLADAITERAAA